jgi:CRISPR-associated endonuclease Cas1
VGHGIRRLVVVGADGVISLAALSWLSKQDIGFGMFERNGKILATTGPVASSDARLRRAQSTAHHSGVGLQIARFLIEQKIMGQETLVRDSLREAKAGQTIASVRIALEDTDSVDNLRYLEAQAGRAYWSAWRSVTVSFPKADLRRVPNHWQFFGSRISSLSGSPRVAINPLNAMLNYLYAVLESEARLAVAALGLDPGLGFLHMDSRTRDSLACDVMEPVRPQVDSYLLSWARRTPLRRDWFYEQVDGNCRLTNSLAIRLSETSRIWATAVAPWAEFISRTLWSPSGKRQARRAPATPLTGNHRRLGRGGPYQRAVVSPPQFPSLCRGCGASISRGKIYCSSCAVA